MVFICAGCVAKFRDKRRGRAPEMEHLLRLIIK